MTTRARRYVPPSGQALTIPTPSGVSSATLQVPADGTAAVPSGRPTRVPDYDVDALAAQSSWETQLRRRDSGQLPIDLAVPIRRRASADGAPLRAAFLLSHVDDRTSIGEISTSAQIPIADTIACFQLLASLGIVELGGTTATRPAPADLEQTQPFLPKSDVRTKP